MSNIVNFYNYFLLILISFNFTSLVANDAPMQSYGGGLFPVQETRIKITKEILTFKKVADFRWKADVYFEFFNPDSARDIDVAFVFTLYIPHDYEPYDEEDIEDSTQTTSVKPDTIAIAEDEGYDDTIDDFTVIMNEKSLDWVFENSDDMEGLRIFKAHFLSGKNIIKHGYLFTPNGYDCQQIEYILLTAKNWAGSSIDDFELRIFMKPKNVVSLNESLEKSVQNKWSWGNGSEFQKWPEERSNKYSSHSFITVQSRDSILLYKSRDFTPSENIRFELIDNDVFFDNELNNNFETGYWMINNSDDTLNMMKNYLFAYYGFVFQDKSLNEFFNKKIWYYPDKNAKKDATRFNPYHKELFDRIVEIQKKRKKK